MDTTESATPALNRAHRRSLARTGSALGGAGLLVAGSAAALLTAFAGSAGASTTITVDSNGDGIFDATHCTDLTPGNCTLRDAAAAAVDGDTITFDASIANITLTSGQIIAQAVSIVGPGASALTITTTAAPYSYDVFRIGGTGDAVISGLTITKNRVKALNDGMFTLDSVTISGSHGAYGGALYAGNDGVLEIIDSTFENNTANDNGGAVYIYNENDATISGSTFTNNEASYDGGAIYASSAKNVSIIDSVISGNSAAERGGGVYFYMGNDYAVNIIGCTLDSNVAGEYGGAADFSSDLSVVISNTTVSNNSANGGAGLNFDDSGIDATINNSTIAGNAALNGGSGIYINSYSSLTINQSTVSANSAAGTTPNYGGGGIAIGKDSAIVTMSGTIISGNTSAVAGAGDIGLYSRTLSDTGSFTATNSIIGEVDSRITANGTNNVNATDPMLGALANNGGSTKTMAPLTGSPAIDAGPNPVATFTGNGFDQRGTSWVRIYNGTADIGALEVQPDPNATTTTTATDEPVAPAFTG